MSDITEYIANLPKPDCAVSVNGNYLEDTVRGYRTSSVTGRNAITIDVTETTIGNSNGSRYRRKRDESRDLTVSFALVGATEADVHMLSRLLQKTLNDPESKFIFADEPTMYWIGTVSGFTEEWQNGAGSDYKAMTGEFTIRCSDPYRHSNNDTTVITNGLKGTNVVELTNNGSSPTPLYIEAYIWEDTKYLGFSLTKDFQDTLSYILGVATASTTTTDNTPHTVLSSDFTTDSGWILNAGILPPSTTGEQVGSIAYGSEGAYVTSWGDDSTYWHGPSLSHTVPAYNSKYPTNWRANYNFYFDDGQDDAKSWGNHSVVFADGSGDNLVTIMFVDSKDDQNTEIRAIINRTTNVIGTIAKNGYHISGGGNVTIEKVDSDVHVMVSYPNAVATNVIQRTDAGGKDGKQTINGSASWSNAPTVTFYAMFEEVSTNPANNESTIEWSAYTDQSKSAWTGGTYTNAAIIDVYIENTIVCTEFVPCIHTSGGDQSGIYVHETWKSGTRRFTVKHDANGNKTASIRVILRSGLGNWTLSTAEQTLSLKLSTLQKSATIAYAAGSLNFNKHYTIGNPTTTLRQVTWWTGAYGNAYSEDSSGTASGHKRFTNSKLKSLSIVKYADTTSEVKKNQVYFAGGDTITIDTETNQARQNGTVNLNMVDITSEPLLLYPGTQNLKIVVDYTTANHPPTLLIKYKERWK